MQGTVNIFVSPENIDGDKKSIKSNLKIDRAYTFIKQKFNCIASMKSVNRTLFKLFWML